MARRLSCKKWIFTSVPGIPVKFHTTIYIPKVTRNNVFPETSSLLSLVALAVLQNTQLWSLPCRTELSAVDVQPSPATFSLRAQNKGCSNVAQDDWKKGWLMLHLRRLTRLGTQVPLYRNSLGLNISLNFSPCAIVTRHCEISPLNILVCYLHYIRLWNKISNNLACLCVQSSK